MKASFSHNTADMLTELFGKHRAKISQIRNSVEKDVGKMKLVDYLGTDGLSGSSNQQVDRQGRDGNMIFWNFES